MGSLVEMGLVNALIAGLLAIAALIVTRYSRRPALAHSLWVLVLVKLITPPLVSLPIPGWRAGKAAVVRSAPLSESSSTTTQSIPSASDELLSDGPAFMRIEDLPPNAKKVARPMVDPRLAIPAVSPPVEMPSTLDLPANRNEPAPETSSYPSTPDLRLFVAWLWMIGAIGCFVWTLCRIVQFQRLLRFARPASPQLQEQARKMAQRLGIARCPGVWLLPGAVPPMLWAVGRARLYFPEALLPRLPEAGRSTLLVHELAHLARRDHWVRWLELLVGCLYWWCPLVWLARSRLRASEEECCDAWVTNALPEARPAYAGALLATVDFLSRVPAPLPPAASGFGRVHQLKRRLTMIVRGSTPRGLSLAGKLIILALALALPLVPSPVRSADEKTDNVDSAVAEDKLEPEDASSEPTQYQAQGRVFQGGGGQVWQTHVSPDGKTLAVVCGGTGDNEGALVLFDLPSGKERATLTNIKPIRCVRFSPDGKHLATGDFNNTACLRDPKTGAVKRELKGHSGSVNSVVFTHDSKNLITAGLDKTIKVWQVSDGKNTHTLTDHTDWVLHVSMSPDGKTLLSTSRDMTARVWDVPTYKIRHVLKGHGNWVESGAVSPDNQTVITLCLDNSVKLWNAKTGKLLRDLSGHTAGATTGVFLDGGKRVATSGHDMTVRLWDVGTGNLTQTVATEHTQSIYTVTATPDGKTLITGSWDKSVKLWDIATMEAQKKLQPKRYRDEANFPLLAIACSRDGKLLATAGEEKVVKIVDAKTGMLIHLLDGHEDMVGGLAFSVDNKTLATAGFDGLIRLWDVSSGKLVNTLKGHENWVFAVAYSPDGKYLASAGYDRTVRIWDAKTGKHLATFNKHKGGVRAVAWSADSTRLATAGTDKAIRIWDVAKKETVHTLKGHEEPVRSLAFTPDGKRLISGAEDMTVRLWNIADEKQLASYKHTDTIRAIALSPHGRLLSVASQDGLIRILDPVSLTTRSNMFGHQGGTTCLAFSPDARSMYSGGSDRVIRQWQAAADTRSPIMTFRDGAKEVWVSSYSPDGKWLVTGGSDRVLRLRPAQQGNRPWSLAGLGSAVYGATMSPDGNTLATGHQDNTVKLWDWRTGKKKASLEGHKDRIWSIAFSPDGKRVATASGSWNQMDQPGEVKVWDVAGSKELASLAGHDGTAFSVAWSKDGKHLVTSQRDGTVRLFDATTYKEQRVLKGHKDTVRFVIFSPGDKYVATAGFDGFVKVWTVAEGKEVASIKVHDRGVNCVSWSADGKYLAAVPRPDGVPNTAQPTAPRRVGEKTTGQEVYLYDITYTEEGPTFKQRAVLKGHTASVLCCAFSPDSKSLASAGGRFAQFGEAIVWDVATNKERMQLHGHRMWCECLTFSKDSQTLFTGGGTQESRGEFRAWQVAGKGWTVVDAHKGQISCAAWSKDGKTLATGCLGAMVKVWDVATGKVKATLNGHKEKVLSLAFSPDGRTLASSSSDKTVRLWDMEGETEAVELTRHRLPVVSVAYSPDGKWLATASADPNSRDNTGDIKVFDARKGKEHPKAAWSNQPAKTVAFSPDGKILATAGSGPNSLKLYEVASGKLMRTMNGTTSVRVFVWSPDGKRIATGNGQGSPRGNGSIQIWDVATGNEVMALLGHTSMCPGLGYSPDGKRLASASNDGTVKVWELVGPANQAMAQPLPAASK